MTKIINKEILNSQTILMDIESKAIASKAKAGQFIVFRLSEFGERVPLTINDTNVERGTIRIVFQMIGKSTIELGRLNVGDEILDLVGPLGHPTEYQGYKNVCVVVGGLGCAIGFLSAKQIYNSGVNVDIIAGFRNKDIVILEDEMSKVCNNLYLCSDDGSVGFKGFVSDKLDELIAKKKYDLVLTIGPLVMMRSVSLVTSKYQIRTMASLNPIMIDASGMCGGCRVTVDGKIKFACVEGPDFDASLIDFNELIVRNNFYQEHERDASCRLLKGAENE